MDMTGEALIAAPRDRVYAALNDIDILRRSIPGCEAIEWVSEDEMTATVVARVGPVKAKFIGHVTLSDRKAPEGYTISGEGKGGPAGFAKGGATVRLKENGTGTLMTYQVHAKVGGKLAQIGGRLIDGTAKKMADQFFTNFGEIVGADAGEDTDAQKGEESQAIAGAGGEKRIGVMVWIGGAVVLAIISALLLFRG